MDLRYRYQGPVSAVTLAADAGHPKGRDVLLAPGAEVVLPDDNAYVKGLVARKHLTLLGPVTTAATTATTTSTAPPAAATAATTATTTPSAPTATTASGSAATAGTTATTTGASNGS